MEQELKEYGLSDKEVQVYIAGLKAGSVTASKLFELTGIRRSTVYEVLESLKKKGIIKTFKKDKKSYFEVVEPKHLIGLLKEKERLIERVLPELNKLIEQTNEKPEVVIYEGKTGIKNAANDMLEAKEILIYGASNEGEKLVDSFPENFARKRVERKIKVRAILGKDAPEYMLKGEVTKYTEVKIIDLFTNYNIGYFIYGNSLLIITLGDELTAVKIKSPLLVDSQRKMFELLWKIAKK